MKLTLVLFDGLTALDVVGGYEVLALEHDAAFLARLKALDATSCRRGGAPPKAH